MTTDESRTETRDEEQPQTDGGGDELARIEDDPPKNLEDWPGGKEKYKTFGGPESETGYDEGPTAKLGPADLERHEDGSISIRGEKVDNPEDYKGDPIPGGPTDPDAPVDPGQEENLEDEGEAGSPEAEESSAKS